MTVMVSLTSAPLNSYAWTWGAIAVYAFTLKSYQTYRRTKNPLARIYTGVGFSFATALLFFGFPGFLTQNPHVLLYTYFMADIWVQTAIQFAAWQLWFIGTRTFLSLKYILSFTIPLSVIIMCIEVMTSKVYFSQSQNLIIEHDKPPVLILKSIIYILVSAPLAFYLLRQVPKQANFRAKYQSFIAGMIYIAVTLASVSDNVSDRGADTRDSCYALLVFFTIFLVAQLPRPSMKH
jgi:hypothetical protein